MPKAANITHKFFATHGQALRFSKGTAILQPNEEPLEVYCIESGFVKAYTITKDGLRNIMVLHKKYEIFPLPGALNAQMSELFYEAKTDVRLRKLSRAELLEKIKSDATFSNAIMDQLLTIMDVYNNTIQDLQLRTARERIMSRMLFLSRRFGAHRNGEILINAPITHQETADSLNMTRETASRELRRLSQHGLIEQQNHLLIVKDLKKIRQQLE